MDEIPTSTSISETNALAELHLKKLRNDYYTLRRARNLAVKEAKRLEKEVTEMLEAIKIAQESLIIVNDEGGNTGDTI